MHLLALPVEDPAVRRFVDALWLPYHRELEATVADHTLADDIDLVEAELAFRMEWLAAEAHHIVVALESTAEDPDIAAGDGRLVGFITMDIAEAPPVFDRPDRLVIGDVYVEPDYRGAELASALLRRAIRRADREGCPELALTVDVDNRRAVGFYEKVGFEPVRQDMLADSAAVRAAVSSE